MKRKTLVVVMSLVLLVGMANNIYASEIGAKTSSTADAGLYSNFDPNFEYLDNGQARFISQSDGKLMISGDSNAKQYVSTIGVQLTIQQWDGSSWHDYYVGRELTASNESRVYVTEETEVPTGYYYRIHSVHWTIEGGLREQGDSYTSSTYIN